MNYEKIQKNNNHNMEENILILNWGKDKQKLINKVEVKFNL